MTRYEVGRRFEWRVRRHFEKEGYFVVRAAGSKGPVDLVAVRKSYLAPAQRAALVLFIQCKVRKRRRKRGPFEQREATDLMVLAARYGAAAIWAERVGRNVSYRWLGSR